MWWGSSNSKQRGKVRKKWKEESIKNKKPFQLIFHLLLIATTLHSGLLFTTLFLRSATSWFLFLFLLPPRWNKKKGVQYEAAETPPALTPCRPKKNEKRLPPPPFSWTESNEAHVRCAAANAVDDDRAILPPPPYSHQRGCSATLGTRQIHPHELTCVSMNLLFFSYFASSCSKSHKVVACNPINKRRRWYEACLTNVSIEPLGCERKSLVFLFFQLNSGRSCKENRKREVSLKE